jgi:hypothetical protein
MTSARSPGSLYWMNMQDEMFNSTQINITTRLNNSTGC